MTIEQALEVAASRGLLIKNLFQLGPAHWRCNIRRVGEPGSAQKFFDAATAREALEAAVFSYEMPIDIEGLF